MFNLEILEQNSVTALTDLGIEKIWRQRMEETENNSLIANVSSEWDVLARELMKRLKEAEGELEDFRFLTMRLLYMLNSEKMLAQKRNIYVTKGQRMIAENAKERLCRDFKQHLTVEKLAKEYGVSPSSLKKYFRLVYGSMSIGEIAAESGYLNQSKFGSAFKKHTGEAPLEYRRRGIEERCSE